MCVISFQVHLKGGSSSSEFSARRCNMENRMGGDWERICMCIGALKNLITEIPVQSAHTGQDASFGHGSFHPCSEMARAGWQEMNPED